MEKGQEGGGRATSPSTSPIIQREGKKEIKGEGVILQLPSNLGHTAGRRRKSKAVLSVLERKKKWVKANFFSLSPFSLDLKSMGEKESRTTLRGYGKKKRTRESSTFTKEQEGGRIFRGRKKRRRIDEKLSTEEGEEEI